MIEYRRIDVLGKDMYNASAEHIRSGIYMSLYIPWAEVQTKESMKKFKDNAEKEFKGYF